MSTIIAREVKAPDGQPVAFPNGIRFGPASYSPINNIGLMGGQGAGVGICPGPLPVGMAPLFGYDNPAHDNYGNYMYSDGSIMRWRPAYFIKFGTGANGLALNRADVKPFSAYPDVATANAAGYSLDRAFYDGGAVQPGYFEDKYLPSNNGGIASSLKNGIPLASATRGGIGNTNFASLTGAPTDALYGAIAAAKTRGPNFFPASRFMQVSRARIALAHAQASTSAAWNAWYDAAGVTNYPKGCNNNALGDANDAAILYLSDGSAVPSCGKTGSANLFARTTDNGQNSGICDVNGLLWEIGLGLTVSTDTAKYFVWKTAVRAKDMTAGAGGGLDCWGTEAQLLAAGYEVLGATYGALLASSTAKYVGNAAQVFSEATEASDHLAWQAAAAGVPLVGGVGGTNAFGQDILYDYQPAGMCPVAGGAWNAGVTAGVWTLYLTGVRGSSDATFGFRAALYL
jgi:hypothetical protein